MTLSAGQWQTHAGHGGDGEDLAGGQRPRVDAEVGHAARPVVGVRGRGLTAERDKNQRDGERERDREQTRRGRQGRDGEGGKR